MKRVEVDEFRLLLVMPRSQQMITVDRDRAIS